MFNQRSALNTKNGELIKRMMVLEFVHQQRKGQLLRFFLGLIRRSQKLASLAEVAAFRGELTRHYAGIQTVSIDKITGSENRLIEFDRGFYPMSSRSRERWVNVAVARTIGESIPPVTLIQFGETYFVRNGHHRVSVAKLSGQQFIEAEVTVWQTAASPQTEQIPQSEQSAESCQPVNCQGQAVCQC